MLHHRNLAIEVRVEEEGSGVPLFSSQVDGAVGGRFEYPISAITISKEYNGRIATLPVVNCVSYIDNQRSRHWWRRNPLPLGIANLQAGHFLVQDREKPNVLK